MGEIGGHTSGFSVVLPKNDCFGSCGALTVRRIVAVMRTQKILISGAGIAGPALAYLLHRQGFTPTVVERAPELRLGGQAVDLRGAGRAVVESMGLMRQVMDVALDQRGMRFVDANGRVRAEAPRGDFGGEGFVSELEVLRGDLGQVFYDATASDVEYIFDDTITALEHHHDGLRVAFKYASPRRFDLVIGADGLHSTVRRLTFGPESQFLRPLNCYTAWFTIPADVELDGWYLMHNAPGGLVASIRPGRLDSEAKAGLSFRSGRIEYDRRDQRVQRSLLHKRFAKEAWLIPHLLAGMEQASDFSFESMAQVDLEHYTHGRVALVGDAGYSPTPLTGLGTSLALVGAYVLAGELAQANGDHRTAFQRYEHVMRPYVSQGQELAPGGVKSYAPMTQTAIRLRDASMRWMSKWPLRSILAKQFSKANGIHLPEYPSEAAYKK